MDEPILNNYEKELVRFFAQQRLSGRAEVPLREAPGFHAGNVSRITEAVNRLLSARLVRSTNNGFKTIEVAAPCIELVRRWENPDYKDKFSKWFWSKRWSVPFHMVTVLLPAGVGYVVMLKTLLEWFGVINGSR